MHAVPGVIFVEKTWNLKPGNVNTGVALEELGTGGFGNVVALCLPPHKRKETEEAVSHPIQFEARVQNKPGVNTQSTEIAWKLQKRAPDGSIAAHTLREAVCHRTLSNMGIFPGPVSFTGTPFGHVLGMPRHHITLHTWARESPKVFDKIRAAQLMCVLADVCSTVGKMHKMGFVHMDIKSSNVMLRIKSPQLDTRSKTTTTPENMFLHAQLLDFGLSVHSPNWDDCVHQERLCQLAREQEENQTFDCSQRPSKRMRISSARPNESAARVVLDAVNTRLAVGLPHQRCPSQMFAGSKCLRDPRVADWWAFGVMVLETVLAHLYHCRSSDTAAAAVCLRKPDTLASNNNQRESWLKIINDPDRGTWGRVMGHADISEPATKIEIDRAKKLSNEFGVDTTRGMGWKQALPVETPAIFVDLIGALLCLDPEKRCNSYVKLAALMAAPNCSPPTLEQHKLSPRKETTHPHSVESAPAQKDNTDPPPPLLYATEIRQGNVSPSQMEENQREWIRYHTLHLKLSPWTAAKAIHMFNFMLNNSTRSENILLQVRVATEITSTWIHAATCWFLASKYIDSAPLSVVDVCNALAESHLSLSGVDVPTLCFQNKAVVSAVLLEHETSMAKWFLQENISTKNGHTIWTTPEEV
jgi:serine/threonine protein kinase